MAGKRAKATSALALEDDNIPYICLYRHKKSGHHSGTKTSKFVVVLSGLIGGKVSIYNNLRGLMILDKPNSNTIFY